MVSSSPEAKKIANRRYTVIPPEVVSEWMRAPSDKKKPRYAIFAGIRCPPIGGKWWIYRRKPDEPIKEWRRRIRTILREREEHRALRREMAEAGAWSKNPLDQLLKLCSKPSRFEVLSDLEKEEWDVDLKKPASRRLRGPSHGRKEGPRSNRGYEYIEGRLALKSRLALLQDEWREARVLRREKMARVVILNRSTHEVQTLKGNLLRLFEEQIRANPSAFIDETPRGEMDDEKKDAHGSNPEPIVEKKSTVILADKEGESKTDAFPRKPTNDEFSCLAAPVSKISSETYDNRWITIKQGKWTNEQENAELFSLCLPRDILNDRKFQSSPNYAPFRNHTFWNGTMKVKINVNANARQYGQLQARFYYQASQDAKFSNRNSIYVGSQQPHVLISASSSNSGVLTIPYQYCCPVLSITRGEINWDVSFEKESFANLGTLSCRVVVPLTVASTTAKSVGYSVLICFEDSRFSGLVSKNLIETNLHAEMFPLAAMYAMQEIKDTLDDNRDNPTLNMTGMPMIPVNTGSWCIGNDLAEWTNVLRLNPRASLPYPAGRTSGLDEMKINYVTNIFGMFKILDWTSQMNEGKMLYSFPASPVFAPRDYPQVNVSRTTCFVMPPVAVISSLYAWWRGSMNLRIDVVGAAELTGRLLVSYIPKYSRNVSMDDAFSCAHTIFDLQGSNRQFNFEIPFLSERLFWARNRLLKDQYEDNDAPGTVYIYVYNPLVANSTIPDNCKLILYLRGGNDFEVSVPAFPTIGLSFNPTKLIPSTSEDVVKPISNYYPMYISTWRTTNLTPIFRYSALTDHVTQFEYTGKRADIVYQLFVPTVGFDIKETSITFTLYLDNQHKSEEWTTTINVPINGVIFIKDSVYTYGIPILGSWMVDNWQNYKETLKRCYDKTTLDVDYGHLNNWYQQALKYDMENCDIKEHPNWHYKFQSLVINDSKYVSYERQLFIKKRFAYAEGDDERKETKTKPLAPQRTSCGRAVGAIKIFGEKFLDLKDYCRRYQLYAMGTAVVRPNSQLMKRLVVLKFIAMPQGLDLKVSDPEDPNYPNVFNKLRDGPIPIIASGYRYFCGGLRFRLAIDCVGTKLVPAKIFVQHRPDVMSTLKDIEVSTDEFTGFDDLELSGYATYYQFDDINNIISFEIPFYIPVVKSLLQRPVGAANAAFWTSLGEVAIGLTMYSNEKIDLNYELYYSLADDARFSTFLGFPPMIDVTDIPPDRRITGVERRESESSIEVLDMPQGEMGFPFNFNPFSSASNAIENVSKVNVEEINSTVSETKSFISSLKSQVLNYVPTMDSVKNKINKYMSLIINIVTNFIHCLLNFNLKSVVTALVSMFTQIKLVSYDFTTSLIDSLFTLFKKVNPCASNELAEEAKNLINDPPTGEMLDDVPVDVRQLESESNNYRAAYCSTLVAGVAAALALAPRLFKTNFTSLFQLLFDGLKNFAMTANHLFTFVKNNLICIQKIGNWLVDDSPGLKDIKFLEEQSKDIYEWCLEVIELTDPWKENELFTSIKKASRVHLLCVRGNIIMLKLSKIKLDTQQYNTISKLLDNISKLRDRLVKCHMAPPVRWEPFVYELTGKTGTGKSALLNTIPYKLLDHMSIKHRGEPIYHRALGNAYWNNCRNQPVCSIDEKFPVTKPGFDDVQMAELFQLKSRCVFNPPMADLPDKNLRYNPLIVQYASNNPFPQLTGLLDPEALYRRRDVLIDVSFTDEILKKYNKPTIDKLTYDERRNFKCLRFHFAANPVDSHTEWEGPFTYDEMLHHLCRRWANYYVQEEIQFKRYMKQVMSLHPRDDDEWESYETRWQDEILGAERSNEVNQFRQDYETLLKESKEKKLKSEEFTVGIFKTFRKLFGIKEELTDDEILNRFKEVKKIDKQRVFGIKQPKGQMRDDITDFASHIITMAKHSELKKFCPHDLLFHYELHVEGLDFDTHQNVWCIPVEILDSILIDVNRFADPPVENFTLTIKDYAEVYDAEHKSKVNEVNNKPRCIAVANRCYHIAANKCNSECCWTKPAELEFIYKYIQIKPQAKHLLSAGHLTELKNFVPKSYIDHLRDQINDFSSEEIKNKQKEEVGFIRNIYETLKEKLMSISWKKWFQRLAIVTGIIFFIGTLWCLWTISAGETAATAATMSYTAVRLGLSGGSDKNVDAEAHTSGDFKTAGSSKKTPRNIAQRALLGATQGQMAGDAYEGMCKVVRRNTFKLIMHDEHRTFVEGKCVGICGRYALITDHFFEAWSNFSKMYNTTAMYYLPLSCRQPTVINLDFKNIKYTKFENSSLGLLELPVRIPAFRDIRKSICPMKFHAFTNGMGSIIDIEGDQHAEVIMREINVTYRLQPSMQVRGGKLFSDFKTGTCYAYEQFHGAGKCGSLLVNPYIPSMIIGMHVAGNGNFGFSESIYQEMFANLNSCPSSEQSIGEGRETYRFLDAQVIGIGAVPARYAHRANEKTRIAKSFVQLQERGEFPVFTETAVLTPKDPRLEISFSPMIEGCKHHGKPLKDFNPADLTVAVDDLKNLILSKCKPQRSEIGILDRLTAINGIDGALNYDKIEWNSSEGFPFVAKRPASAKDKRWLFTLDDNFKATQIHPELECVMNHKWNLRNQNIVPETVFTDCLKDCTVAKEKVLEPGKTRIFSISPVDFTIQQRQCTLDFTVAYMANRLDLEHAIGINPDSLEWSFLTERLSVVGDSILTGDYSKFGDTIPPEIIHAAMEIIVEWYRHYGNLTPEHEQQLKIMSHEIANSTHLMFNFIYRVVCGQPSGNSLTVILNSLANSIYVRLAWLSIMRFTKYNSLVDLHNHVKWFSYGDDLIASLSDEIKDLFNAERLHQFFGKHDLKFTNADKSELMIPYTTLDQAEFLKRGFSLHPLRVVPQVMLAPLGIPSIEDTVNWVNKETFGRSDINCEEFKLSSVQVCEDSLRNAFGRGPEYYENYRIKLQTFWREFGINFVAATWSQLDAKVFVLQEPLHPYYKFKFSV